MRHPHGLRAAAGNLGFDFLDPANIGLEVEGGFFAGLISHTADGVATHALIVAPRDTGMANAFDKTSSPGPGDLAWKTSNTSTAGTTSPFDGAANTAAMVTAGIADHPAAEFCVNLSIGGFTDWYLPARFELDIAYENLKPSTTANNTSWGINDYSVPKRTVNRTAGDPAQTSIASFQRLSGAEYFAAAASAGSTTAHWSSTQASAQYAWQFDFANGFQTDGSTNPYPKTQTWPMAVRAFRRIAL
jgi:hypothetical protein